MIYNTKNVSEAPLFPLGNGDLLFALDCEGATDPYRATAPDFPTDGIYRTGHRDAAGAPLCYGKLSTGMTFLGKQVGRPYYVSCDGNVKQGVWQTACEYDFGVHIDTRICAFHNKPLILLNKRFGTEAPVRFGYTLELPEGFTAEVRGDMILAEYRTEGHREMMCFFCTCPVKATLKDRRATLQGEFKKGVSVTFALCFAEDDGVALREDSALHTILQMNGFVYKQGTSKLFSEHTSAWEASLSNNELVLDDPKMGSACDGARYLLRILASEMGTPLSHSHPYIPGGHSATEDLKAVCALLHEGTTKEAREILAFWHRLLAPATARFAAPGEVGARYPFYTDEGGREYLPDDFRRGRVIQTCAVAAAFREYDLYTDDREYLKTVGYPVLLGCASYLMRDVVREQGDGVTLVCADLDSLGAAVTNPFLSSVAVAATLLAFDSAAGKLGQDRAFALSCRRCAEQLLRQLNNRRTAVLPEEAMMYVHFYRLAKLDDENTRHALISHAVKLGEAATPYDNALVANAYADHRLAAQTPLRRLVDDLDAFGFFRESGAEGMASLPAVFLDAVYSSFICWKDERLYVGFGLDPNAPSDGHFHLLLPGNIHAEGRIREGKLTSFRLTHKRGGGARLVEVLLPSWLYEEGAAPAVKKLTKGGVISMTVYVK